MCILYKPGPQLYITDLLCHNNHAENRDQEILAVNGTVQTLRMAKDIPVCTSIEDLQTVIGQDMFLQRLKMYIIRAWPNSKDEVEHRV